VAHKHPSVEALTSALVDAVQLQLGAASHRVGAEAKVVATSAAADAAVRAAAKVEAEVALEAAATALFDVPANQPDHAIAWRSPASKKCSMCLQ
jgi:hypothetical protein